MRFSKGRYPADFNELHGDDLDLAISIANGVFGRYGREDEAVRIALEKVKERQMTESAPDEATEAKLFDENLSLAVSIAEAVMDNEGVVRVPATLIEKGWSKNDRYYSEALLESSPTHFEGCGAFSGHIRNPSPTDYVGVHEGVQVIPGGRLTSTFTIFDPDLARVARHAPHLVELSINTKARIRRGNAEGRSGWIVESWGGSRPTCDAVINAGARGSIGAVLEAFEEELMDIKSTADLKEAYPDFVQSIAEEARAAALAEAEEQGKETELKESLAEMQSELTRVSGERDVALTKIEVLESRDVLDAKLSEADLPEKLETRIREQFSGVKADPAAVDAAIDVMRSLLADVREAAKVSDVEEDPEDVQEQAQDRKQKDLALLRRAGFLEGDE